MKKLFALIVSLLTLGIADALYAQEEVWHTYKLADLSDYGYTTWSIPKGNENKFLLVVDSFALTGHRIVYKMYNQDHYSVLFTKIDQKYKDKIITRVSACKEDSLPREYSFVPNKDRDSWMIVDSMEFNDTTSFIVETPFPAYLECYTTCDGTAWGYRSCYELTRRKWGNGSQPYSSLKFKKHAFNRSSLSGSYDTYTYNYISGQYYAGIPYPILVATTGDGVPIRVYQRVNEPCCNEVSGVKVVQLDSTSVSVVWNEAHPKPAIGYKIVIETKDHLVIKEDTISGDLTAYSYKGLQDYTDYILSVTSVCGKEFTSDSIPIRFRTKLTYCRSVSNVISEPQKSDVSLKWTSPVLRDDYPNIFYRVAITGENGFSMRQEVTDTQSKPFCPDYTCLPSNTSYTYAITTVCDENFVSDTVIGQFTTLPCGTVEPVKIYDKYNYARLAWSYDPVFSGYHVRLTAPDTDMKPIIDKDVKYSNYEFKELSSNTTYAYEVTPYCVNGGLGTVSTGKFTTLPCLPVTGVQIEPGQTDVKLSWDAPEPKPHSYMTAIFDSLGKRVYLWESFSPNNSAHRLEPNTTYQYSITTHCSTVAGSESEPATGEFTTLPCPSVSNVRAEVGLTGVKLSWDKPASEPYGYRVILTDEAGTTVTDSTVSTNPFSYSNLEPNTTYHYSIAIRCTENSAGVPVTGEFTTQTCLSVSNIRTEVGLTDVKLSWDSPESEPYGYQVILTDEAGQVVTDSTATASPFAYSKLEPNTTYKYSVSVKCTETILSEPVTGEFTTLPCLSVTNIRAAVGLTDVKLSWDKPASEPFGYRMILTDEAGQVVTDSTATASPFAYSKLEPNTTYHYSVSVKCTETILSEPVTGEFTTLPCPSVSNVRTEAGLTDVKLSWESPESKPYGYRVILTNEAGTTVTESTATTPLFSYSKLEPNTTYHYSIAIRCTENSAGEPVTGEFTTQLCPSVSNVRTEAGLTDVKLSWESPESKPYGYRVILTNEAGTTVTESTATTPLFSYSKLEPNTTYHYSIAIRCTENSAGEPVTGEFTTQPCGQVNNVQTTVGMTDIGFTWEADNHYAYLVLTESSSGDTVLNEPYAYGSYSLSGLEPNTTYRYSIALKCTENSAGEPVTGKFTTQPCGQVNNVQTTVGMTDIGFTWEADNHYAYLVLTESSSGDTVLNEPYAYGSYSLSGLEPNTTYRYSIALKCTENSAGEPVTGKFTTQPCGQVNNVQTTVGMTDIGFTWEADNHYAYLVLTESSSGDTVLNEPYAYGSYSLSGLEPNTTYRYSIALKCTENSAGEPVTGKFTTQPCGQVNNVQTTVGMTDIGFTWEADNHYAYLVLTESSSGDTVLNEPYAYGSYSLSGLEPNTTYRYSIALKCTENSAGEPVTGEFTTLPCGQVTNVNIKAEKNSVKLNWNAPESEHSGYNVTLTRNFHPNSVPIVSQDITQPSFFYNKLESNTSYNYSIVVKCTDGILGEPVTGSFKTLKDVSNTIDETLEAAQIYPNPNTGEAVIETKEPIRMEIFSPTGILVETKDVPIGKQVIRFTEKGVFMIRLSNPSGITTKRIVVL